MKYSEAQAILNKQRMFRVIFFEHKDVGVVEASDYEIPFPGAAIFFDEFGRKSRSYTSDVFSVVPIEEQDE